MKTMHPHSSQNEFHSLFVGDLPPDCNEEKLQRLFQQKFKSVKRVQIIKNEDGSSRGFGFIRFEDRSELQAALSQEMKIGNVSLRLDMAHTRDYGRKKNRSRYNSFNSTGNNNNHNNSNHSNPNHHDHHNHHPHQHQHQNHQQHQHHHNNFNNRNNNNTDTSSTNSSNHNIHNNDNNSHNSNANQINSHHQHQQHNNNTTNNNHSRRSTPLDINLNTNSTPMINNKNNTNESKLSSEIIQQTSNVASDPSKQQLSIPNIANNPALAPHPGLPQTTHGTIAQHPSILSPSGQPPSLQAPQPSQPQVSQPNPIIQTSHTNLSQGLHSSLASAPPLHQAPPHQQQASSHHQQASNMMPLTSMYGHMYPYGPPTFGYMPTQPNPVIPISGVPPVAPQQSPSSSAINQQQHGASGSVGGSLQSMNAGSNNARYNTGGASHQTPHHQQVQTHTTDASGLSMMPGGVQGPHQGAPQLYYYYPSPLYFDQATGPTSPPSLYHPQSFHPQFFAMPNPAYMPNAHTYNQHLTQPPSASPNDATSMILPQQHNPQTTQTTQTHILNGKNI